MRIGIATWGSDGDIRPMVALGAALARAGHEVTLALTSVDGKDYGSLARRVGIGLVPMPRVTMPPKEAARLARRLFLSRGNALTQLDLILGRFFDPLVGDLISHAEELATSSDILIGHCLMHPFALVAEERGIPYLTAALNHAMLAPPEVPSPGMPDLGPSLNALVRRIGLALAGRSFLPAINSLRARRGLPLVRDFRDVWESPLLNLVGVSRAFLAQEAVPAPHHRVCGFFALPEGAEPWEPSTDLRAFLHAGPPPIYVTLGSMFLPESGAEYDEATARLLVAGVEASGERAIIQAPWERVARVPESPSVYRMGRTPHAAAFPLCSMVVHHGGSGTTQTALRSGLPSVVLAHVTDQEFWGAELRRLGVAPAPLARRSLSARALGRAIREVRDTPAMAARAREVGAVMAGEDGAATAARLVGEWSAR